MHPLKVAANTFTETIDETKSAKLRPPEEALRSAR